MSYEIPNLTLATALKAEQYIYNTPLFAKYHVQGYWSSNQFYVYCAIHDQTILSELKSAIAEWNATKAVHLTLIQGQLPHCIVVKAGNFDNSSLNLNSDTRIKHKQHRYYQDSYFTNADHYTFAKTILKQSSDLKISHADILLNLEALQHFSDIQAEKTLVHELGLTMGLGYVKDGNNIDSTEFKSEKVIPDVMSCRMPQTIPEIKSDAINCLLEMYEWNEPVTDLKSDITYYPFVQHYTNTDYDYLFFNNRLNLNQFNQLNLEGEARQNFFSNTFYEIDNAEKELTKAELHHYVLSLFQNKIIHNRIVETILPTTFILQQANSASELKTEQIRQDAALIVPQLILRSAKEMKQIRDVYAITDFKSELKKMNENEDKYVLPDCAIIATAGLFPDRIATIACRITEETKQYKGWIQYHLPAVIMTAINIWNKSGLFHFKLLNKPEKNSIILYFNQKGNTTWGSTYLNPDKPNIELNVNMFRSDYRYYGQKLTDINFSHTIAHELGHAIGLGHNTGNPNNLMYPYSDATDFRSGRNINTEIDQWEKVELDRLYYADDHDALIYYKW